MSTTVATSALAEIPARAQRGNSAFAAVYRQLGLSDIGEESSVFLLGLWPRAQRAAAAGFAQCRCGKWHCRSATTGPSKTGDLRTLQQMNRRGLATQNSARPNHLLKRSANGMPPAPGLWHVVHHHSPGAGVMPLSPA